MGPALHTEFMAKADSGGGLLEYVADGPQLANVVKISKVGGSYYLAVSFPRRKLLYRRVAALPTQNLAQSKTQRLTWGYQPAPLPAPLQRSKGSKG